MKTNVKFIAASLLIVLAAPARSQANSEPESTGRPPKLAVKIMHSERPKLSNLERIPVQINLQGSDFELRGTPIITDPEAPKNVSGTWLQISAISASDHRPVPIHIPQTGGGMRSVGTTTEQFLSLLMDIPDDRQRDKQVRKFVAKLLSQAQENSKADPDMAALYSKPNTQAVVSTTLARLYLQNRVGSFELRCSLISRADKPGTWKGTIDATPVKFEIEYKGYFFDQPNFKK